MEIVYDDIIYWLQRSGGITTYWNELTSRTISSVDRVRRIHPSYPSHGGAHIARDLGRSDRPMWFDRYLPARFEPTPDTVFHSSYYRLPASPGVVSVVTLHDFAYERFRRGPAKMIHSAQKFAAVRRASLVICISEATRRDALHYLPDQDPAKFVVVHHGVSDCFHPQESGVAAAAKHVLFVGVRNGYKRFDIAMNAVREHEGMALHFTGPPPTASEKRALDAVLPGRWRHAGLMDMSELNALYNAAWALIYPSDHEGFGLPVLEAMRAGCPVICSNRSSLPEVGGSAAMYAKEQTTQAYAEQLQTLAQPGERRRRQAQGLLHAEPFSWDASAEKTVSFYERALNGRV